jgi:putative ABC transport system substrate-binding protein
MDRRVFLTYTTACALILSSRANSQRSGKLPRVAHVANSIPLVALAHHPLDRAFVAGLRDLGLVEGQNIILERRSADEHYDRLPLIMQELLALPVDVIVAIGPGVGRRYERQTRCRSSRSPRTDLSRVVPPGASVGLVAMSRD